MTCSNIGRDVVNVKKEKVEKTAVSVKTISPIPSSKQLHSPPQQQPSPTGSTGSSTGGKRSPHSRPQSGLLPPMKSHAGIDPYLLSPTTAAAAAAYLPHLFNTLHSAGTTLESALLASQLASLTRTADLNALSHYYAAMQQQKSAAAAAASVCRDPYCTLCPPSSTAAAHPANCSSCKLCSSQKEQQLLQEQQQLPFVCNCMVQQQPCGKRFNSSESLLHHLHSHTQTASPEPSVRRQQLSPVSPTRTRTPTSPIVSSARYHPYCRPSVTSSLSPHSTMPLLPTLSSLSPYASLYGHRLAANGIVP